MEPHYNDIVNITNKVFKEWIESMRELGWSVIDDIIKPLSNGDTIGYVLYRCATHIADRKGYSEEEAGELYSELCERFYEIVGEDNEGDLLGVDVLIDGAPTSNQEISDYLSEAELKDWKGREVDKRSSKIEKLQKEIADIKKL